MILNLLGIEKDMEHEHRPPIIERTLVIIEIRCSNVIVLRQIELTNSNQGGMTIKKTANRFT